MTGEKESLKPAPFDKEDWNRCAALFCEAHGDIKRMEKEAVIAVAWIMVGIVALVQLPGWWKFLAFMPFMGARAYEDSLADWLFLRARVKGFFEGFHEGFEVGASRHLCERNLAPVREVITDPDQWRLIQRVLAMSRR